MAQREPVRSEGGFRASVALLRGNGDFRKLYLASMVSLGGDWFLLVALFGLALELTSSPLAVALLMVAQDVPFLVLSPVAGHLADRLDRRRLMVACDLARALLCLGFLLVRDAETMWAAYLLLAAISAFSAVFNPASTAALPNLVDEDDLSTANALAGSIWGTMLAVGAALGGIVAATLGRDAAFVIDAVSFAASGLLIARIRRPLAEVRSGEAPGLVPATAETVRYARRDHRVLALLGVKAGFGLGAGVIVLLSVFAEEVFHAGDIGIGVLMAARGVGALMGPFLGRRLAGPDDRRLFPAIGVALAVFGAGYAVLGVTPTLLLAAVSVAAAHLGGGAQWILSSYGLQRITPDRIRGRLFAFDFALITATIAVSSILTGWAAATWGPRGVAIGLGAVAVAYAAVWTWLTTDVRRAAALEGLGLAPEPAAEGTPAGPAA